MAGPRVLEHMVDTVLYFEGDRHASYRILRGVKNRFGSTNEIGVFEMRQEGLCEVKNPSEFMRNGKPEGASGSVVSCSLEEPGPFWWRFRRWSARAISVSQTPGGGDGFQPGEPAYGGPESAWGCRYPAATPM